MNQMLQYIMLVAVGVLVAGPIAFVSVQRAGESAMSFHDFAELERERSVQSLAVTYLNYDPGQRDLRIHLVNTGLNDIRFAHIMVDGEVFGGRSGSAGSACTPDAAVSDMVSAGALPCYCFYRGISSTCDAGTPLGEVAPGAQAKLRIVDINGAGGVLNQTSGLVQMVTDRFKLFEISLP